MNIITNADNKGNPIVKPTPLIILAQLKHIVPNLPKSADVFIPYLNDTLRKYNVITPNRIACFIAQVAHESGGFRYTRELASGKAYEGRADLGNAQPGDGMFYKGRGLIQITGRTNYMQLSKDIGIDFINKPQLLEAPQYAALSAGWYWNKRNLNKFADLPEGWRSLTKRYTPFQYITYLINGGQNGTADREEYYRRAKEVI